MNGKIIGVEYISGTNKSTNMPYELVKMRWAFPCDGVTGAEVRTDSIMNNTESYNQFRPFLNGKMHELVGMTMSIDLMPTGRVYNNIPQMKVIGLKLNDDKHNAPNVK